MNPETFANSLILTGPTGSGKSRLALELAPFLRAEIVSMDSMTLYRGMDIGTAKPSLEDRASVRHHLLDVLDPSESASVAWWLEQAAACVKDIEARGRVALFVGGTSFYLKAVLFGLFDGPPGDEGLRARLAEEAENSGKEALHGRLITVDPTTAARLHPNDVRRVIRALEVHTLTGKPISAWQTQWPVEQASSDVATATETEPARPPVLRGDNRCLCLDLPRDELYQRIDERVAQMFERGLAEEARALGRRDRPLSREARQALGYKELFAHFDGQGTLDETIRDIQTHSRQFAKRQLTAFRHISECLFVNRQLTFDLWKSRMREEEE